MNLWFGGTLVEKFGQLSVYAMSGVTTDPATWRGIAETLNTDRQGAALFWGLTDLTGWECRIEDTSIAGTGGLTETHYWFSSHTIFVGYDSFFGPNTVRPLFALGCMEVYMDASGRGWDSSSSMGQGFCRALVNEGLELPGRLWLKPVAAWLNNGRPDWVQSTEQAPLDLESVGCAYLFATWLVHQGFSLEAQARQGGATLRDMYAGLTGFGSAWLAFTTDVFRRWPAGVEVDADAMNPDPWSGEAPVAAGPEPSGAFDWPSAVAAEEEFDGLGRSLAGPGGGGRVASFIQVKAWFEDDKPKGWSERVYVLESLDLPTAVGLAVEWLKLRSRLLGVGVEIVRCIVSADDTYRDALPVPLPDPARPGAGLSNVVYNTDLISQGLSEYACDTLGVRAYSGTGTYHANYYLSGIPDSLIVDGKVASIPAWQNAWKAYRALLIGDGKGGTNWAFKVTRRDGAGAPKDVQAAYSYTPVGVVTTYQGFEIPAHGLTVGQKFRLSSRRKTWTQVPSTIPGTPVVSLTGVWQVNQVIDADNVGCAVGALVPVAVTNPDFYAKCRPYLYVLTPYEDLVIVGPRAHARGAGFQSGRGKRRRAQSPR